MADRGEEKIGEKSSADESLRKCTGLLEVENGCMIAMEMQCGTRLNLIRAL